MNDNKVNLTSLKKILSITIYITPIISYICEISTNNIRIKDTFRSVNFTIILENAQHMLRVSQHPVSSGK